MPALIEAQFLSENKKIKNLKKVQRKVEKE